MPNRHNSHDLRQRYKDDSLGSPQAQDCDPKSSNSNARHTQDPNTSESSSSSSSHQSTATHDRDSDPNDPHAGRWRRINALGGLGSALEHMVGNVPERRAERARVDALRVAQVCIFMYVHFQFQFQFQLHLHLHLRLHFHFQYLVLSSAQCH